MRFSLVLLCLAALTACTPVQTSQKDEKMENGNTIYGFTMNSLEGKPVSLGDYKGKVLLIVNVASECGYTPQYKDLEAYYKQHAAEGFSVLGFPANDFGAQEPGSDADIRGFCEKNYGVTFPMFSKITVVGEGQHPLYKFLTHKDLNGALDAEVKWNFNKFLIDRSGHVVAYFPSRVNVTDEALQTAIAAELKK